MTAEEIRKIKASGMQANYLGMVCSMLQEIAAQFAEFNERRAGEDRKGYAKLIRSEDMRAVCQELPTLEEQLEYIANVIEVD